jgi:hypothetical protein
VNDAIFRLDGTIPLSVACDQSQEFLGWGDAIGRYAPLREHILRSLPIPQTTQDAHYQLIALSTWLKKHDVKNNWLLVGCDDDQPVYRHGFHIVAVSVENNLMEIHNRTGTEISRWKKASLDDYARDMKHRLVAKFLSSILAAEAEWMRESKAALIAVASYLELTLQNDGRGHRSWDTHTTWDVTHYLGTLSTEQLSTLTLKCNSNARLDLLAADPGAPECVREGLTGTRQCAIKLDLWAPTPILMASREAHWLSKKTQVAAPEHRKGRRL